MSYLTGLARFTVAAQATRMPAGPGQPARPVPPASHRKHVVRAILRARVARWPADRPFRHATARLGVAVGAARASGRDSRARMVAWDIRQRERHEKALAARNARSARQA